MGRQELVLLSGLIYQTRYDRNGNNLHLLIPGNLPFISDATNPLQP